ncbi:MAG TPA: KGG domain-containing protein [Chitinophagaceae bacterium]|nr:KGG domain-containing protein [Chitinophagaceae bacterium]
MQNTNGEETKKLNRGFAAMDPAQRKMIASEGGRAAHKQGVAHKWTTEEAREAGRKGGLISRNNGRKGQSRNEESSDR